MTSLLSEPASDLSQAGWQVGRSILEVNRYMLETQLRTDVKFRLLSTGGVAKEVGGHSYVLTSRSPVFEAMLSERWSGKDDVINIDDVSADIFEEFLK